MYASVTKRKRFRSQQHQPSFFFFFSYLTEELITEILSWLPVESLIRFKCVSKSWNSLISNPSFIQLHFHKSSKLPHRLILLRTYESKTAFAANYPSVRTPTYVLQLLRLDQHYRKFVMGSCNGLVCLLVSDFDDDDWYGYGRDSSSHFLLWNPATRLMSQKFPCFCRIKPTQGYLKFGFGYDKSSHTYKVVSLRYHFDDAVKDLDRTEVKVYTFGGAGGGAGGGWRKIQSFPGFPFHNKTEGTFLSGTLNWVAIRNFVYVTHPYNVNFDDVAIHRYVIVSLDLGTETYKQFSLPPFGRDEMPDNTRPFDPVLEVFLDCLYLSYDWNRTHFIMWQMKEFGVEKSWTRFVKVSTYHHLRWMLPLCISDNGDVLILRRNSNEIILYNRRDNRVQHAYAPTISNKYSEIYVKGYAPSLVSPYCK